MEIIWLAVLETKLLEFGIKLMGTVYKHFNNIMNGYEK